MFSVTKKLTVFICGTVNDGQGSLFSTLFVANAARWKVAIVTGFCFIACQPFLLERMLKTLLTTSH